MSERRTTAISVGVEQRLPKERRTTSLSVGVERRDVKERRISSIAVMVEIGGGQLVLGHAGPRIQMMV